MKTRVDWAVAGVLFCSSVLAEGCGAEARPAQAAPAVVAEPPPPESPAAESKAMEAPPPPPPPAPAPASIAPILRAPPAAGATAPFGAGAPFGAARSALTLAEQQLQASAGDCTTACRALGSMERATAHLCSLASSSDEQGSCQDARSRVLAGRDRVRTSCGECPGGPSLDRNAPIPSSR